MLYNNIIVCKFLNVSFETEYFSKDIFESEIVVIVGILLNNFYVCNYQNFIIWETFSPDCVVPNWLRKSICIIIKVFIVYVQKVWPLYGRNTFFMYVINFKITFEIIKHCNFLSIPAMIYYVSFFLNEWKTVPAETILSSVGKKCQFVRYLKIYKDML